MTTEITRAQVREALSLSKCLVPDFTTREKATLSWSKVYVSIQDGELRFVELNFFQRIIRYLVGCSWYTDTIFTDKAALEKVKTFVHGIKAEPSYHDPIAMELLPKVKTATDRVCLWDMLENCKGNDEEAIGDLAALQKRVEELGAGRGGFSENFLSAAIVLARQNLKKNPEDEMWRNITEVFVNNLNWEVGTKNEALLRQVLGLPEAMFHFPSQQIEVSDEITAKLKEGLEQAKATDVVMEMGTLKKCLKTLDAFEKIYKALDNLPEVLRPFLTQESGKQMVLDLRNRLINSGVHPSIVKAYLEDEKLIAERLYFHADLSSITPSPIELTKEAWDIMIKCKLDVLREISSSYEVIDLGPQSKSFLDCYGRYSKTIDLEKLESPIYFPGLQVLSLLSKTTGRPVLVVCLEDSKWIEGINLGFEEEPIILNVDNKGIWCPVEKIQ